jgi:hypothetical protein
MDAQDLDAGAAVGLALTAGNASAAGKIGHHVDDITDSQVAGGVAGFDDSGELMTHDARVFEKGLVAAEDMQVGAADADTLDSNQDLSRFPDRYFTFDGG